MLKRKIEEQLIAWKEDRNHKPLIIKGCRQCGKTYTVQAFGKQYYKEVVYLNFFENPYYSAIFSGSLEIETILLQISALLGTSYRFPPGETLFIFDEIQECPNARTALKFFKIDGRFDVIGTGSLLGVQGYGNKETKSIPVGYETMITMFPLDFEEFLWAANIEPAVIQLVQECYHHKRIVPEAIHQKMRELLLHYVVVGGMPEVVQTYVDTKNMARVQQIQRDILLSYQDDMIKYADKQDKAKIRECFLSIPKQLAKENKKFQFSVVTKGSKASQFLGSLQWLEDAGIISRCYNLSITELPLEGNALEQVFKVYMVDTGLFLSMLEEGTQFDVLQGNLLSYKGAIFENLAADIFTKAQRKLYYFHKDSGLEIDFVTRLQGQCTLIEVKATTGNTKSTRTILAHPEKYHVYQALKFGDYNLGEKDGITTFPLYMLFCLSGQV